MLAKVPPKRNDGKSSFKSLQKYMEERDVIDPETGEVIGWEKDSVAVQTNCLDRDTAWREMLAVADMNGRVKDPVYHVTLNWQEGENPTDEQAFEAARKAMKAVGMEDHQYVAAVHRDTDNAHVHLMVNRVHPDTYKAVYPDRDYFKLDKCVREIELEQGWRHSPGPYAVHERDGKKVVDWSKESPEVWRKEQREKKVKQPTKAKDMERHTGNESLHTYAQGQPQKDAKEALSKPGATWQDLHQSLAKHGLELRPTSDKQNAFRVHSKADPEICIKASSMAEELGGGKLVKRLGPWQEPRPEIQQEKAKREYSDQRPKADPKRDPNAREEKRDERAAERRELRERYKAFTEEWKTAKAPARAAMYEDQKQRRQALTEKHKSQRETIRTSGLSTEQKKALYSVAAFDTAAKRAELNETIKGEREAFRQERPQSFREWTADRAQEGDRAAMRQVRGWAYQDKRTAKDMQQADAKAERGPHLGTTDTEQHDPAKPRRVTDRVSWAVDRKTGAVDYKVDDRDAFRDSGRRLDYTEQGRKDKDSIEAGLLLAREKFAGKALKVTGPDDFRERVLQTAIERKLDVRFSDKELEQRREAGLRQQAERERPDWSKMRGVASTGERPQQPTQAQQPERRPTAPEQAKEAAQAQPAQQAAPRMTDDEARAVLNRKAPAQPNQELVEINAINAHADGYRQQLDKQFREKHGERPDPERAGGWIARFAAKSKAEAWDKEHAQIDRQVEQRKEHLRSDAPEARQFRAQAWAQAQQQYGAQHTAWEQARKQATAHFEPNREGEPNMANNEHERKQQQQTQQQAQQKQAQEKQMAERAAREAQARQLAEKQKQQKEKQEKEKEQARMMNQQMDIDR
ncbi:TraI/MobA(P) family conjugative relaxase [Citrobacter sp. RHBSTW-00848]|uniref:TraI/MobA(P) family conjugative relaxase n=1 Tax=Citrobacter sp. RHBSTW-00848 TaxID=2742665 RepID=UPI0015E94C2D|nr:TraI/MobA(P) family conjugative relaxase [Citrobacter sp. RHBSTW-00848]QMR53396.1 relaxase/mobilization nuclease domain-containing protein [Citrobacter sp. RHBSTW-00848]